MIRPRKQRQGVAHDRWLIPYADLVTLLFAFFTALYAVTSADVTRVGHIAEGVRAAVGTAPDPAPAPADGHGLLPEHDAVAPQLVEPPAQPDVRAALERGLADELLSSRIELIEDRRGLVLAIPEAGAFDNGRANLTPVAEQLIGRIARVLADLPNAVRVEGHTDDTPISTARFRSNWDLSTARATEVVAYFIEQGRLAPDRLSAAGYAEYRPRDANLTPAGRARNRRVDIVVLNVATETSEEPSVPEARP
jgi:chemotaxis protein MotB